MSRTNADASVYIPRMIPWRDWDEWRNVKALLFSPDPCLRCQGVQHVAVWRCRERIPHAVETTSQLVEVRLNDAGPAEWGIACARRSEEELRLVYSTVVLRAVNGLTGHEQKTAHAAPVSSLAREIGLPTWLVDIRHEAAHKQLPGIVILRLAADFLMSYLWRRYWEPQSEHLGFVWAAFGQLISRYKATSEGDSSKANSTHPGGSCGSGQPAQGPRLSPSSPASKKRRGPDSQPLPISTPPTDQPAVSRDPAPLAQDPTTDVGGVDIPGSPPTCRGHVMETPGGGDATVTAAATATEVAAREISVSVTPTALSWALLSLLADGWAGGEGWGSGHGGGGGPQRGQGHLLPRSRDKYPTPGTPGIDKRQLSRRVTGRWATLLDVFHVRWRGFGAALLVRLVEALLRNASLAESDSGGGMAQGAGSSGGGGGSGKGEGLERQAKFIGLWVRHLLSRRWHLRGGDGAIHKALRGEAREAGLSSAFCDDEEALWGEEESAWADEPASPAVLQAAFFPTHELLQRCRRLLSILAALPTGPDVRVPQGTQGQGNVPTVVDVGGDMSSGSHWAKEGLDDVCCYLQAALGGKVQRDSDSRQGQGNTSAAAGWRSLAFEPSRQQTYTGATQACVPVCDDSVGATATTGLRSVGVDTRVLNGAPDQDGDDGATGSGLNGANSPEAVAGGRDGGSASMMMDLESLERMLGGEGRAGPCPDVAPASSIGGGVETGTSGAADDAAIKVTAQGSTGVDEGRAGAPADGVAVVHGFGLGGSSVAVGDDAGQGGETGDAWELVEGWTPCAIGVLPGWSGVPLGGQRQ